MFDSPFERCTRCGNYVLLDQTQQDCAREHGCTCDKCPLGRYFTGKPVVTTRAVAAPPSGARRASAFSS